MPLAPRVFLLLSLALVMSVAARAQEATPTPSEPDTERVYTFGEVTKPAVILSMPDVVYHRSGAKLLDVGGLVKVSVVLTASGRVADAQVVEGLSQNQNFAALKAARRITFMPALKNGVPVSQSLIISYEFKAVTEETGRPEELKGLTRFYLDTGGDREALGDLTGELQKQLPQLVIVERPEEAECILKFDAYRRTEMTETRGGRRNGFPVNVDYGRAWAIKPVGPDKRRVLMYYVGSKGSFVESSPVKTFVKAFAYEYKKANGIDD